MNTGSPVYIACLLQIAVTVICLLAVLVIIEDAEKRILAAMQDAEELLRRRKAMEFEDNQDLCGGWDGGCDGDLEAIAHEENCPARAMDMKLRPHLYVKDTEAR